MLRRLTAATALFIGSALGIALLLPRLLTAVDAGIQRPDDAVATLVLLIGVLLLGWYLTTAALASICLLARAAGRVWLAGEHRLRGAGAPLARRLLLTGGGAALATAAVLSPAAAAAPPTPDTGPVVTLADDLGWGADTDATDTSESEEAADEQSETTQPDASDDDASGDADDDEISEAPVLAPAATDNDNGDYTVLAGDSLWEIAANHLPEGSSDAEIAAAWPRWYAQNSDLIGNDPDLIQPGLVLTSPGPDIEEEL